MQNPFYVKGDNPNAIMASSYPTAEKAIEVAKLSVVSWGDDRRCTVYDCSKSPRGTVIFEIEGSKLDGYIFRNSDSEDWQVYRA